MEMESSGSGSISVPYLSFNKSLWMLIVSVICTLFVILLKIKTFKPNSIIFLLVLLCVYNYIPVLQGRILADQTFWYHYSMVLFMPFVYVIYTNYPGNVNNLIKIFTLFSILIVIQEFLTILFNGYSYSSLDYKHNLRLPLAHSNIIAVILLSILVLRISYYSGYFKGFVYNSIILLGLILTKSRGAIIFFIAWIILLVYQHKYGNLSKSVIAKVICGVLIIVVIIVFSPAIQKFLFKTTLDDIYFWSTATSGRTDIFILAIELFFSNPLFGEGLGVTNYDIGYEVINTGVHNVLIDYLVQCGIIGTLIYGYAIYLVYHKGNKKVISYKAFENGIMVILLYSMTEVCYFNFPCLYFLWTFCGLYDRKSIIAQVVK